MKGSLTRRAFFPAAGVLAAGAALRSLREPTPKSPAGKSAVAVLCAPSYSGDLASQLLQGARACGLEARGKRVLLKPNLVEFAANAAINTEVAVMAAAIELFERLGAAEVLIGEGPGHRRDTIALAEEAGYRSGLERFEQRFTDLNCDDPQAISNFAGLPEFYFSKSALGADLIISIAKMKTHHWAGVTLSMKNLFGLVPGALYGWPKNQLHYIGIDRSIRELCRTFPRTFAIVDGIVGMEGNGPIQGSAKQCGVVVMGANLVAADATCCRIMGIDPEKIEHLRLCADLGHIDGNHIEQRGESIRSVRTDFALIEEFRYVRLV